ncbi:three-Cys-motif partner protein TcmP [Snodgrassella alvi]|uniref:three-Cys-motif partner protein TcmP n=1 Tax=Snodgrassella alvi TaxID=1196083 RepID=UPI00346171B0
MRTQNKFNWGERIPELDEHSKAKLKILESYLILYFKTLSINPRMDNIKVTIVDGFAGGGLYQDAKTKEEIKGSPLVCLDSVKLADYEINHERTKRINLDVDFIFNDKEKTHIDSLKNILKIKNYLPNKKIHFLESEFASRLDNIIDFIKNKNPKNGRSIFILDQCGYANVPFQAINKIFNKLPTAEIILTFAVDAILNYASANGTTAQILNNIGINNSSDLLAEGLQKRRLSKKNWRFETQFGLYKNMRESCVAKYFTPFFIRNKTGHGYYWLIHMSQHPKARDVMMNVHWENHNYFIHYGGAGLNMFDMLGYDPDIDVEATNQLGFEFDNKAEEKSINELVEDLPNLIYQNKNGITFEQLFTNTCNTTPATSQIYRRSLNLNLQNKEILIVSKDGKTYRRSANSISDSDIILPAKQMILL